MNILTLNFLPLPFRLSNFKTDNHMSNVKFYREEQIPLEMHKVRVVQKLTLLPVEERLKRIQEAGNREPGFVGGEKSTPP